MSQAELVGTIATSASSDCKVPEGGACRGGLDMVSRISTRLQISGDAHTWRRFSMTTPSPNELIEIRRCRDNKTILRRRSDLPPSFAYKTAEWRSPA